MKVKTKVRDENEVVENVWTKDERKFEREPKAVLGCNWVRRNNTMDGKWE